MLEILEAEERAAMLGNARSSVQMRKGGEDSEKKGQMETRSC